ncbi:MAG: DUF6526 family protein [Ferruginibacter sp.]
MTKQNYKNHIRYYPPHHFIFYPLCALLLVLCIYEWNEHPAEKLLWAVLTALVFLISILSFMMRQHYALTLQNRIVLMELRFRYYVLTQKGFDAIEQQLSFKQMAALRFASDDELPALIRKVLDEKLSPDNIKRSIKNWKTDKMRV